MIRQIALVSCATAWLLFANSGRAADASTLSTLLESPAPVDSLPAGSPINGTEYCALRVPTQLSYETHYSWPAPPSGGPYIRQYYQQTQLVYGVSLTAPLSQPVLPGSTILVYATEMNIVADADGVIGGGPAPRVNIIDTQGGAYVALHTLTSQPDWQSTLAFYRPNASGGTLAVTANYGTSQWQGILAVEVANVAAASLVGSSAKTVSNVQTNALDWIASDPVTVSPPFPAFVVGFGMNATDYSRGAMDALDYIGAPNAGTGFTPVFKAWNWHGHELTSCVPTALVASKIVTAQGPVVSTFSPLNTTWAENYYDIQIVLRGSASVPQAVPFPRAATWLLAAVLAMLGGLVARGSKHHAADAGC